VSPLSELEDCFRQGLLRRVEPSSEKGRESIRLSREWLGESEINLRSGAYRSALSSAYTAMFHSARGILFRDGVREKSHYCIGIYLASYVERGLLEDEWFSVFDRMRSARHTDQYSFNVSPTAEEARSAIDTAKDFVGRMERLMKEV
jgi:uncharacterized protein (UPF0332 family)